MLPAFQSLVVLSRLLGSVLQFWPQCWDEYVIIGEGRHILVSSSFSTYWCFHTSGIYDMRDLYQTVVFSGEPHWNRDLFNRFLKIYCLMFIVHVNVIAMSKLITPSRCLVSSFFILHHVVCRHPPRSSIASLLHLSKQYFEYPIIMICKPLRILCTNCNY